MLKPLIVGTLFAGTVFGGGVTADQLQNPYTDKGSTLEIKAESTLKEAGTVATQADKTAPKITLSKWSGRATMGVTYMGMSPTTVGDRPFMSKNVEWTEGAQKMEAVPLEATTTMEDGGMEINIILNSNPATTTFNFKIAGAENMDFFYQPPLTDEEIKDGTSRPDNVVGSYAVYAKDKKDHLEGQINYTAGKLFHVFRPLVTDAHGATTWADLSYIDGVLTVTVPQKFLDDAVYPVKVDPTFGYTSRGASFEGASVNNHAQSGGQLIYRATGGETVTSFSIAGRVNLNSTATGDMGLYTFVGGVPVTKTGAIVSFNFSGGDALYTSSAVSTALSPEVTYSVAYGNRAGAQYFNQEYDSGAAGDASVGSVTTTALPTTWSQASTEARKYTMYVTYTEPSRTVNTSQFTYCRTITSNNDGYTDGIATTTTGLFPLIATTTLSTLAATSSGGNVQQTTNNKETPLDVVFVDEATCSFGASATAIPHTFEHWASTTGQFVVHLGTSNISSTSAKVVAMYYGNSAFTTNLNSSGQTYATTSPLVPAGIWTLGLPGFATTTYPDFLDSTYNGYNSSSVAMKNTNIVDGVGTTSVGMVDGALSFNGTTQYVNTNTASAFNFTTQPFTITAWVKRGANGARHTIFSNRGGSNSTGYQFVVESDDFLKFYRIGVDNSVSTLSLTADNKWHFVAVSILGSGGNVTLTVDGASQTVAGNNTISSAQNATIGLSDQGGGGLNYWNGFEDDARVYNKALTSSDIATIYNNTSRSAVFWTFGNETTQSVGATVSPVSRFFIRAGKLIIQSAKLIIP